MSVPIRTGVELCDDSHEENIRIPILTSLRYERAKFERDISKVYVNNDGTSDTGREIIKAHIGVCGRAFVTMLRISIHPFNHKLAILLVTIDCESRSRKRDVVNG